MSEDDSNDLLLRLQEGEGHLVPIKGESVRESQRDRVSHHCFLPSLPDEALVAAIGGQLSLHRLRQRLHRLQRGSRELLEVDDVVCVGSEAIGVLLIVYDMMSVI